MQTQIFGSTEEVVEKLAELVDCRTNEAEKASEDLHQAQAVLFPDSKQGKCTFTIVTESSECE